MVTDKEIEAALNLSAERKFDASLALYQAMLIRTQNDRIRMKILLGIVTCSTWLNLDSIRENAIQQLKQLPDYEVSDTFVVMARARAYADSGRVQEALNLINENLSTEVLQRHDLQEWKYEHLFRKGRYLVLLTRYDEALSALNAAYEINPEGEFETDMLIERSNCFLALSRYDEAFEAANRVLSRGDEDMATLAMQYVAECRLWQRRGEEAMTLYRELQRRLPSRLVNEERVDTGIRNGMAFLESHPQSKPF